MTTTYNTIIFDLGGVLLDWNPLYVYDENYFSSIEQRDYFFSRICTSEWNEEQDAGRSIVEGTQLLVNQFPDWEQPIRDYYGRWTEMLRGPIDETVDLFRELKSSGKYKLYALTNWQADLFNIALVRYNFLHWFDGRVVSGVEKTRKPFPAFYNLLLNRYSINPSSAIFIDDNLRNVAGAEAVGIKGIHFQSPAQLKDALLEMNARW
jgi:2-haloacid dehalogenase